MKFQIIPGETYRHKPSGGLYRVHALHHDATGYERSGKVREGAVVLYEQLVDGERYSKGTMWTRKATDFRKAFEHVSK